MYVQKDMRSSKNVRKIAAADLKQRLIAVLSIHCR